MELESPFRRLIRIANFAMASNNRDQIIAFLSGNVCPFGEVSGAGSAVLGDDGYIKVVSRHGFTDTIPSPPPVKIDVRHPATISLNSLEVQIVSIPTIKEEYPEINPNLKTDSEYKTGIWVPISPSRLYGFALSAVYDEVLSYHDYFEALGSILQHWERLNEAGKIKPELSAYLESRPLTSRQEKIVELIREGRTNLSIANILGYSESLIKQETILIYRKLGVDGRHELLNHPNAK